MIGRVFFVLLTLSAAAGALARDLTLPDPMLTPGFVRTELSAQAICSTKWGTDARHVTAAMKKQVFEEYGLTGNTDPSCIADAHQRRCEVDHLISRELGGADDVRNLWPQPYGSQPWNAVLKDRVENRLHSEVCAGRITLQEAQREISTDWRVSYVRYFGQPQQAAATSVPGTKPPVSKAQSAPTTTAQLKRHDPIRPARSGQGCECPYDRAANGSICGARSAWSRPGGRKPVCYTDD